MFQTLRSNFRIGFLALSTLLLSAGCSTIQPNTCADRTPSSSSQLNPAQSQACEAPAQHRDMEDMNLYRNGQGSRSRSG